MECDPVVTLLIISSILVILRSFSSDMPLFLHEAMACPPNSNYSLCASSCPETCLDVLGEPGCEDQCVEGCECNPGFVLKGNTQCLN
uniref:TIL domain-containing protein n=1 Tax=Mola mola TaxID=94237 RepID=A0A3Q3X8E6_MOLML